MTQHETPRRKNRKATLTKNHARAIALERSVADATGVQVSFFCLKRLCLFPQQH